ncbi:MAG: hypothetical protein WC867_07760 [Candidatus Pacearchaeota archaeon]|jgi:hypothetical protein
MNIAKKRGFEKKIILSLILLIFLMTFFVFFNNPRSSGNVVLDFFIKTFEVGNTLGRMFISIDFDIEINSPQNISYNFSRYDNLTINLNVSSSRNISSWYYTLFDIRHNLTINDSILFIPNASLDVVRFENNVLVSAEDLVGNIRTKNVSFYVFVNNSAPIIRDIDELYVCEGQFLDRYFNVSDSDESIDSESYSLEPSYPFSPFSLNYLNQYNSTIFIYWIFSGIINKERDIGFFSGYRVIQENITVSDGQFADRKSINITLIEINNPPLIIVPPGVQTVWTRGENSTFYYKIEGTDYEDGLSDDGYLNFNLSFSNESLFNISRNGTIYFNATNSSYTGVHNVTVCVIDRSLPVIHQNISDFCSQTGLSTSECYNFSLTITDENRAPIFETYYPELVQNVGGNDPLYFNISTRDPDGTIPDIYWFIDDIQKKYSSSKLIDIYSFSFGCGVSGLHKVRVISSDGNLNSSLEWNLTVTNVPCSVTVAPAAAGGGGGGGGAKPMCIEKWACNEWEKCYNLTEYIKLNKIDFNLSKEINLNCTLLGWDKDGCGFQTRSCDDLNNCNTTRNRLPLLRPCFYTINPTCYDKIKNCHNNSCEILVDCGGPCKACPSCSDGILNQGEEQIDCGGPCNLCSLEKPLSVTQKTVGFLMIVFFIIGLLLILVLVLIANEYRKRGKLLKQISKI